MIKNEGVGLNKYESKLLGNIEEHGWQCSSVFDPDGNDPSFSYSVGFTSTLKSPEFIVFGLEIELMHDMLWEVFRQIERGKAVVDSSRWSDVLEGFDCVAKTVHPTQVIPEYANSAIWYWKRTGHEGNPPFVQLVWPGKLDGLFPWDPDCSDFVREMQPPLYLPATEQQHPRP